MYLLVKIYPLIQKIMHRNDAPKPSVGGEGDITTLSDLDESKPLLFQVVSVVFIRPVLLISHLKFLQA